MHRLADNHSLESTVANLICFHCKNSSNSAPTKAAPKNNNKNLTNIFGNND